MRKDLFRKKALDTLSSPDKTDQLIMIPRFPYWIVLIGLLIFVVAFYLAFTQMTLYTIVEGDGIFISSSSDYSNVSPSDLEIVLFINFIDGHKVTPGMKAQISPLTMQKDEFAYIRGTVTETTLWPATRDEVAAVLNNNHELAEYVLSSVRGGVSYIVYVSPDRRPDDPEGYILSAQVRDPFVTLPGTPCHGRIILKEKTIQEKFFQ